MKKKTHRHHIARLFKNLVDSERLMRRLSECGFVVCHNSDDVKGDIVVVNTCGFIGDAKEESINTILSCAEAKKRRSRRAALRHGMPFRTLSRRIGKKKFRKSTASTANMIGKQWLPTLQKTIRKYRPTNARSPRHPTIPMSKYRKDATAFAPLRHSAHHRKAQIARHGRNPFRSALFDKERRERIQHHRTRPVGLRPRPLPAACLAGIGRQNGKNRRR